MAFPQNWSSARANPDVPVNENFATLAHAAVFGKNPATSTGLTWGYFGGRYSGQTVADGTLTLGNNCDNYVVVNLDTGAISVSEYDVDWLDAEASVPTYGRVYLITTSGGIGLDSKSSVAWPLSVTWTLSMPSLFSMETMMLACNEDGSARQIFRYSRSSMAVSGTRVSGRQNNPRR